jgi:hypothetical protein
MMQGSGASIAAMTHAGESQQHTRVLEHRARAVQEVRFAIDAKGSLEGAEGEHGFDGLELGAKVQEIEDPTVPSSILERGFQSGVQLINNFLELGRRSTTVGSAKKSAHGAIYQRFRATKEKNFGQKSRETAGAVLKKHRAKFAQTLVI